MSMLRLALLTSVVLVGAQRASAAPQPVVQAGLGQAVDAHLSALHAVDTFNGVVLVARGDEVLLSKGYGLADHEKQVGWATDTISCIGSITKQFTAACVMRLVEQGKVRTDDTLARWFQGLPEDKAGITVHQLLTHTAGVTDILGEDEEPVGRDELMERAWREPLIAKPGERYEYSNLGYSILGAIVEKASGQPYEAFLREELLKPAGLTETAYMLSPEAASRVAIGYRAGKRWGMVYKNGWRDDGPGWHLRCNGGIQSTVTEMHRWVRALQSAKVLAPASVAEMWKPRAPEGGGDTFYGYGWSVSEPAPGWKIVGHNGGNGYTFADCNFATEAPPGSDGAGLMFILMTNESRFSPASEHIGRILLGDAPAAPPALAPLADAELARLEGTYEFGKTESVTVTRSGAGVRLEGVGFRIGALLAGLKPEEIQGAEIRAERLTVMLTAAIRGDFQPIADAYAGRVPVERLSAAYADRFAQMSQRIGKPTGVKIVGAAPGEDPARRRILFRWVGDKGESELMGAVWQGDSLVGFNATPLSPGVLAWPIGGGTFRAYDIRTGPGPEFRFEDRDGRISLRLAPSGEGVTGSKVR